MITIDNCDWFIVLSESQYHIELIWEKDKQKELKVFTKKNNNNNNSTIPNNNNIKKISSSSSSSSSSRGVKNKVE